MQAKTSILFHPIVRAGAIVLLWNLRGANFAQAQVVVHGTKLPWSATIPSGWVGGTAAEIESILAKPAQNPAEKRLEEVLKNILPQAKRQDAIFYNIETTPLSSIAVDVMSIEKVESLGDGAQRKAFWETFRKGIQKDYSKVTTVEQTSERVTTTGGHNAYEATFLATKTDGGKLYFVMHLVAYAPDTTQVFMLTAIARNFMTASLISKQF